MKKYFTAVVFLLLVDQLSKYWANESLADASYSLLPFFSLTLVYNHGAAFSFLADMGGWQRYFLSSISIVASIVIAIWMLRTALQYRLKLLSLTLILAGALGNMVDRVLHGFVIDFIHLHHGNFHFPIFNFADGLISIGVVLLLIADWKQ